MPEVSVVIPSYNHAAFISKAVESVLAQSLADLELIVVDDGSKDNSLQVLAGFHDPRLRVIPQANQGAHAAINRGLAEGCGQYLSILNSDDYYAPDRLEKLVTLLKSAPGAGLASSHIQVIDEQGRLLGVKHGYQDLAPWLLDHPERSFRAGSDLRAALLTENFCATTSNYVFSRTVWEQAGPFRPLRYTHDWDFALRVTRQVALALLPEPLVFYRIHSHNTIRENQAAMIFEICWILAVHLPQSMRADWFAARPADERVDQLLYSLYTFGFEKVLVALLALRLDENPALASELLDPANPVRQKCLEFIQHNLQQNPPPAETLSLYRRVRRVLGRIKRAVLSR